MGRGGAQLGKAVKGKSKERKKDKKTKLKENINEKQLSEDIRMLEEYEKLNKLAEAQRQRLKKLLQQETYNTRLNKKLLTNMYRAVMRLEKVDLLRKEIDIVAQNHQRDMDRKDAVIHMLCKDLEESEDQFTTAQRTHMSHLSTLVTLSTRKLTKLEEEFERDLKTLKIEFLTERSHLQAQHAREVRELQNIIQAVETEENERILESKQNHETEREEIRNKNLEGINELRINLENKIEDLERQFDDAHSSYVDNTAQANENFKKLKMEDATLSLHIFEKKKKIIRLQNNLLSWRKKLEYNSKECTARNAALREQKEAISKHCNSLKLKMKRFRESESKRLTELTILSRDALQSNQTYLAQAERLLQLTELSRKMETEREKVTPFYESTNVNGHTAVVGGASASLAATSNAPVNEKMKGVAQFDDSTSSPSIAASVADQQQIAAEMSNLHATVQSGLPTIPTAFNPDGTPVEAWNHLDNFYKKYNKVLLDKFAIAQEKKRLQKENQDLRSILKQYLDGVAITSDAVDNENPLLIVNGRINLVETQVRRGRPKITQELTHLVQTTQRHTQPLGATQVRAVAHG